MAEELPSLHIDTDWKKQAQEEKRRLVEEEQKKAAAAPPPATTSTAAATAGPNRGRGRAARELPPASFAALVNSLVTQSLFYLGELSPQGTEPAVNLDMAKHQVDTLAVLEDKTKGNLSEEEQRLLDTGLYETRNRYIAVASQYI